MLCIWDVFRGWHTAISNILTEHDFAPILTRAIFMSHEKQSSGSKFGYTHICRPHGPLEIVQTHDISKNQVNQTIMHCVTAVLVETMIFLTKFYYVVTSKKPAFGLCGFSMRFERAYSQGNLIKIEPVAAVLVKTVENRKK
jgi:hypothetical protein